MTARFVKGLCLGAECGCLIVALWALLSLRIGIALLCALAALAAQGMYLALEEA